MLRASIAIAWTAGVSLAVVALATPSAAQATSAAASTKAESSTKTSASAKAGSSSRATRASRAAHAKKTKKAKTAKKTKAAKKLARAKAAKAKAARLARAARVAKAAPVIGVTGAGAPNMPRGFEWPPSQLMRDAGAACERDLDAASVAWTSASSEGHIATAVTIDDLSLGGISYVSTYRAGPHKMDCHLARTLAQIGPQLAAIGVREVHFGSIYRWTNVRVGGKTKNVLSRHALGLAMDVMSFVDAAGREVRVARDYPQGDPLLLDVERVLNESGSFRIVLTPRNDPTSHHDHFHIEANPSYGQDARSARSTL